MPARHPTCAPILELFSGTLQSRTCRCGRGSLSPSVLGLIAVAILATAARTLLPVGGLYAVKSAAILALVMIVATSLVRAHHPFARFGAANQMTMVRAALVALVAGLIGEPAAPLVAAAATGVAAIVVMLDGADGWLARRSGIASEFGARFDMEIDALLIMALAILAWQHGKAGGWVLLSGLLRYAFVAAGWLAPWLARPLPPSRRRQAVCVVQIAGLCVAVAPIVTAPPSAIVAATALLALVGIVPGGHRVALAGTLDRRHAERVAPSSQEGWLHCQTSGWNPDGRLSRSGAALVLLNASLAFGNLWPTPAIRWRARCRSNAPSACWRWRLAHHWFGPPSRRALRWLGAVWVVLVIGRYADVTAPALYGRPINLFWDLRHVSAVAAMLVRVASWWLVLLIIAAAILIPFLLYLLLRWALGRVSDAMNRPGERLTLGLLAGLVVVRCLPPGRVDASAFYDTARSRRDLRRPSR